MTALDISPHFFANSYAKQFLEASSENEQEFYPSGEISPSGGSKSTPKRDYEERSDETTDKEETSQKKWSFFSWSWTFEPALYEKTSLVWSTKRLKTQSKLPLGKVQSYLETEPSFKKYRSIWLKVPSINVFVKDINEIWSPDLAHVDKLANNNRNMKYLLVAVDCLSRYLRV